MAPEPWALARQPQNRDLAKISAADAFASAARDVSFVYFFFNIPTIDIIQSSLVVICLKIEVPGEFTIASVGKHLEKVDIIYLGSHFTFARKAYKVLGSRSPIRTWLDVVSATSLLVLVPWRSLVPLKSILSHSTTKRSIWAPGAMESTFQVKETDVSVTWYG